MWNANRPCPGCGHGHGHSAWAVANCSVIHPLRCRHCKAFFHQKGLGVWFWSMLLFPSGLFFAIHWSVGLIASLFGIVAVPWYICRFRPLVAGPKHG